MTRRRTNRFCTNQAAKPTISQAVAIVAASPIR